MRFSLLTCAALLGMTVVGCTNTHDKVGQQIPRKGDEIVVCGQFFHTGGARVVTWMDPGGYDAYRTERRFVPWDQASFEETTKQVKYIDTPNRYGIRFVPTSQPSTQATSSSDMPGPLTPKQFEEVRGGGWPLGLLQQKVDQFVIHYTVDLCSHTTFHTLHDARGLSVQFMLDVDGTIYQTLDCKERAWQATKANNRSIGIEIANIGAYPANHDAPLHEYYRKDANGKVQLVFPAWIKKDWILTPNFIARPARPRPVIGEIQGQQYEMYDLTPQQYASLIKLTATLCKVFPKIKCNYPRDAHGDLITHKLPDDVYDHYEGLLGHYHVQLDKQDPGPAFQWDKVVNGARKLLGLPQLPPGDIINNPKLKLATKD